MAFKINNLMIHVLPDGEENTLLQLARGRTQDCIWVFTGLTSVVPGIEGIMPSTETLALLKAQLQEALAHVQAHEQNINVQMSPQTVEEAQALEDHLTAALEEVKRQKEAFQTKAAEG